MKNKFKYIRAFLLLGLTFFLFAFARSRNGDRRIEEISLHFTNDENLYITEKAVNKLLIQTEVKGQRIGKETLDLNRVERILDGHEMIENAEVFLTVDGKLGATITQKKPIARIQDESSYYLDRLGNPMPLSDYHSARVPLVTGVSRNHLQELFPLVDIIRRDVFLTHHIVAIHRNSEGSYELGVRELDFTLNLGRAEDIERKFNNFKAFYQKAMKDKKLDIYKTVDLRFGNQVVCTKI